MIGWDEDAIRAAILEVVELEELTIEVSNRSSEGTYVSLNVEATVRSDTERTGTYEALKDHDDVRLVL